MGDVAGGWPTRQAFLKELLGGVSPGPPADQGRKGARAGPGHRAMARCGRLCASHPLRGFGRGGTDPSHARALVALSQGHPGREVPAHPWLPGSLSLLPRRGAGDVETFSPRSGSGRLSSLRARGNAPGLCPPVEPRLAVCDRGAPGMWLVHTETRYENAGVEGEKECKTFCY